MSVAFHPDPGRNARLERLRALPPKRVFLRPAPAIPPAPGAAETAGPVAGDRQSDSAPPVEIPEAPATPPVHRYEDGVPLAVEIIDMVAFWHGFTRDDVLGFNRCASLVTARYDAIAAVVRCKPDYSPEFVGRIFRRDRTTIVHAMKKVNGGPRLRLRPPRSASSSAERGE